MADTRLDHALTLYERAVFGGDADAVREADTELDTVEADLALARGRIAHARFLADRRGDPAELELFERAAAIYRRLGNVRGEAEACFWTGCYHQVVGGDSEIAVPSLQRSYDLAAQAGDKLTRSYAVRHLGFDAMGQGDQATARERFEESLRLRRELGFRAGVAAALLALAELSAESGDPGHAGELLAEAETEARASRADGTLVWIAQAQAELATSK